jgi:NADPH2:quinone reductase
MRAIVIERFGGPECLVYREMPEPEPIPGHVVIEVKAFGVNHAEMHMRRGEWAEAAEVSGIECVGLVHACPGGEFPVGAKVAALMGGLGRTINGSYAEYTRAPVSTPSSAASSSEPPASRSPTCRSRASPRTWPPVASRQSRRACSASRRYARHTA